MTDLSIPLAATPAALVTDQGNPLPATHTLAKEPIGIKPGAYTYRARCSRCGGRGQSDAWAMTGYVCYDCRGSGVMPGTGKCYTPEGYARLEQLRAARAARHAEKVAAKVAQAEAERATRRGAFLADETVQRLLSDAERCLEGQTSDFAINMRGLIHDVRSFLHISERQAEVLTGIVTRARDRAHAQALSERSSRHLGAIGERIRDLPLTVERIVHESYSTQFYPPSMFYVFALVTDDGARVIYKGSRHLGGAGDRVVISGTVAEHDDYRGVAQTVLKNIRIR